MNVNYEAQRKHLIVFCWPQLIGCPKEGTRPVAYLRNYSRANYFRQGFIYGIVVFKVGICKELKACTHWYRRAREAHNKMQVEVVSPGLL